MPLMAYDRDDSLQRFGKVKVEATSFTIAEPYAPLSIAPIIYDLSDEPQKQILGATYEVSPFTVLTMTIERIFVDKLFAAEAYTRNGDKMSSAFDSAKHIYDLCVLKDMPQIQALAKSGAELGRLVRLRLREELNRLDGVPGVPTCELTFFRDAFAKEAIHTAYKRMQPIYVFRDGDITPVGEAIQGLRQLEEMLGESFKSIEL